MIRLQLPHGLQAVLAEDATWTVEGDPVGAPALQEALTAWFGPTWTPAQYSPDPVRERAYAAAAHFGGRIIAEDRPEPPSGLVF